MKIVERDEYVLVLPKERNIHRLKDVLGKGKRKATLECRRKICR
jgi:hypothetical protein